MAARDTSLRFDIIANGSSASDAFSRVGRSASEMGGKLDAAASKAAFLDDALRRQAETTRRTTDATLALAKSDDILAEVEKRLRDGALEAEFALRKEAEALREAKREADRLDGKRVRIKVEADSTGIFGRIGNLVPGLKGTSGGASGFGALAPASAWLNPYTIGLGAASLPFLGQLASGAGIFALGGGLAGLGIAGALGTGATVTPAQLTAAQDRLKAAQLRVLAAQAAVAKKNTPAAQATLASSQATVITAQASLVKLQDNAQTPAQLQMRQSFKNLSNDAQNSLAQIGTSFVPVMQSVFKTADSTLLKLTPVFAGAVKIISGPFQVFADTIIKSFAQPAVTKSIGAVAQSFAILLKTLTPQIPGMIASIANGITSMAKAVAANPKAFADFIDFLVHAVGWTFQALAALTRFANYVEKHWVPVFDGVRHELAHIWDDMSSDLIRTWGATWNDTIGVLIRFGHDIERDFNDFRHRTAVVFDGIRGDIAHYWDMTWNNTVGRVSRGIGDVTRWFGTLPGKIGGVFANAGTWLYGKGQQVVSGLWNGLKNIWGSVIGWFTSLPGDILHALGIHSPPQWAVDAGKHIADGLFGWTDGKKHQILAKVSTLGAQVGAAAAATAAALGAGSIGTEQRYAAGQLGGWGWGQNQLGSLIALWNRESGWDPNAVNPSSGAYGIPQSLGHGHPYNLGDWASQIRWGLAYIFDRYGSPAAAWAHEVSFGWYDRGGFLPPGLSLAYNGTGRPEPVGPVAAAAAGGGDTYHITVNVPPTVNPAEAGRQVAQLILAHTRRGGHLYPQGVTAR